MHLFCAECNTENPGEKSPIKQRPTKKTKKAVMKQPRYFRTARRVFIVVVIVSRGIGEGKEKNYKFVMSQESRVSAIRQSGLQRMAQAMMVYGCGSFMGIMG